ncbi:DUF881 domain-containing protein [Streptomyces sp. CBMA123]|uniref:DUF881 domain-containing protein n=1 Tax=Streptomyces sp. CBMA123 TaxID=1896313 RepID=UPI0029500018|nr:DUF881 domain-containing protein [Streptomyces sp. CBMA123]
MPEPGREAAEKEEEKRAEAPAAEEAAAEPVAKEPEGAGRAAEGAEGAAEPEKSDAEGELEAGVVEPEPSVRLTKVVASESEPQPGREPEPEPEAEAVEAEAEEPAEPAGPEAAEEPPGADRDTGRRRLKAALWPPRLSRGQLVVALLLFSLGLGLAIQVRSTNDHHNQLRGARQEDLVRILDELDSRQQRLQQEKAELEQSLGKLENSSNQAKEAQEQTRKKMTELGVLAGTVKATGPGIVLTVDDPQGQVKADMLLDTLQELRAAGAEAIQINDVRVVVNTYFTDLSGGGVQIDGKKVSQPYRFTVVGNPQDLTPALNIPGGVVRTLESHQARATITQQQKVVVDALVDLKTPQYAKPASK